jgi:ribonuclease T1
MMINRSVKIAAVLFAVVAAMSAWPGSATTVRAVDRERFKLPEGVPAKVGKVLKHVDKHDEAPDGYVGGRTFENRERRLPKKDARGKTIIYREWDVNRKVRGKDRGPERLVTGSDGSAYYSPDHYKHFKKIR